MESVHPERRTGLRRPVTLSCDFRSAVAEGEGLITNLSKAGAFVQASEALPPGALAELTMRWSPGVETQVAARVVHRIEPAEIPDRSPGFGLRFIRLAPGSRTRKKSKTEKPRSKSVMWSTPAASAGTSCL